MSEVYEVGQKLFEDMTEMLLNNKNISNDQRRGLREAYVLSKREEYCLIGKSDDEVEEIIRKKSPKDRLSMMKCFKVPYSQHKRRLTVDELIKGFQKEMNGCFPSLRRSLMNAEEKRQKRLADDRERSAIAKANESGEKRQKRMAADKERHAIAKANESEEKRQKRLADDRERKAIAKANESGEKRQKRLADERERRAIARANESAEKRQKRLADDRERRAIARLLLKRMACARYTQRHV